LEPKVLFPDEIPIHPDNGIANFIRIFDFLVNNPIAVIGKNIVWNTVELPVTTEFLMSAY
jgi:hypothetical protein